MTRHRWLRLALPITVVLALTALTVIAHVVQQAGPTDPAFLSPTSTGDVGAAALADRLTRRGVAVQRVTETPAALSAAGAGDVTVFVPAPGLVWHEYLALLPALPPTSRVVLVAPDPYAVGYAGLDAATSGSRWAAAAPGAGCAESWAGGRAAVLRRQYHAATGGRFDCYAGGMVELDRGGAPMTLVGAADVFRNDRLAEHDNAAVAVGLLARTQKVVWLDLHRREQPPPAARPTPAGTAEAPAVPPESDSADGPRSSITDAFPPAFWATLALLAIAAVALAAAGARRLGAPVAEPLPVRVRAAETVRGLGGLYRRARADRHSLATIQAAARRRITEHLGLPPDATLDDRVPGADRLLGDPDQDLATTAEAVQNLVRHVKGTTT